MANSANLVKELIYLVMYQRFNLRFIKILICCNCIMQAKLHANSCSQLWDKNAFRLWCHLLVKHNLLYYIRLLEVSRISGWNPNVFASYWKRLKIKGRENKSSSMWATSNVQSQNGSEGFLRKVKRPQRQLESFCKQRQIYTKAKF